MSAMFPMLYKEFDEEVKNQTGPDAMLYAVNGQTIFPMLSADGGLMTKVAFYVWDGKCYNGEGKVRDFCTEGTFSSLAPEETIRESVKEAFARFRSKLR